MGLSFDLLERPFLNWRRVGGEPVSASLKSLLAEAGTLSTFGDVSPQTHFAVVRVLLVLLHQTRPECELEEWRSLSEAGRFPTDWLDKVKDAAKGRFDLFDSRRPFFQHSRSETAELKVKPPSYLLSQFAAATMINFASHTYDDREALCPACCACGLLELSPFCGAGGSGLMASINNTPPVYFLPIGQTLYQTLLLNWPLTPRLPGDHPQWERGRTPSRIGILEGFTWEPRTVRLQPEAADGRPCTNCGSVAEVLVRRMVFAKGVPATKERLREWRDPHVSYEAIKVGRKEIDRSLTPPEPDKRPEAALGFWREVIDTILSAGLDKKTCRAVQDARVKTRAIGFPLSVSCVLPFCRPGQDKKHLTRGDLWTVPISGDEFLTELREELTWLTTGLKEWDDRLRSNKSPATDIASRAEFERIAEGGLRALLAGQLTRVDLRKSIRDELTRQSCLASRGRNLLTEMHDRLAGRDAIRKAFPLVEEVS